MALTRNHSKSPYVQIFFNPRLFLTKHLRIISCYINVFLAKSNHRHFFLNKSYAQHLFLGAILCTRKARSLYHPPYRTPLTGASPPAPLAVGALSEGYTFWHKNRSKRRFFSIKSLNKKYWSDVLRGKEAFYKFIIFKAFLSSNDSKFRESYSAPAARTRVKTALKQCL